MNKISKEQKSNLAKLLATENINVIHQKVETAYFIPKTRTLCLPIWEEMSNDLYDMLTGRRHPYRQKNENQISWFKTIIF